MGEPQTLREAAEEAERYLRALHLYGITQAPEARRIADNLRRLLASPDSLRLDPEDPESVEAMVRTLYRFYAGPSREHDPAYWQTRARNVLSAFVHWRGEVAREWKASAAPTEETPHE